MRRRHSIWSLRRVSQGIPNIRVKVIVPPKHESPRFTEGHRGNTTCNSVTLEFIHFPITSHIEQSAGRVIGPCPEGIPIREKGNRVDILLMALVRLDALSNPKIPNLRRGVHAPRNENVAILRTDCHGHDVPRVVCKCFQNVAAGHVPVYTTRVTRGCHDVSLIDEATAAEVAIVRYQLLRRPCIRRLLLNIVNRTHIIQPSTGDQISLRLFKGAGHDPRRTERNGLNFIGSVCVPNN
mmetsp:Transcript_20026/g.43402  ORF Transcript_20026/g.43402 Transcript_20026/m.43402 type:complete len:238 (+) Transcript_20026:453-1166(+)